MEDYCDHWLLNYTIVEEKGGRKLLINNLVDTLYAPYPYNSNSANFSITGLLSKVKTKFFTAYPSSIGRVLLSNRYKILYESNQPFTKQTHPELFI